MGRSLWRQLEEVAGGNAAFPQHRGTRKKRGVKKKKREKEREKEKEEWEESGVPPQNKAAIHIWRLVINVSCYGPRSALNAAT